MRLHRASMITVTGTIVIVNSPYGVVDISANLKVQFPIP